jgi:hypothetical protein
VERTNAAFELELPTKATVAVDDDRRHAVRSASAGLANGSHAKLCGPSRVPKPERRGGCRE